MSQKSEKPINLSSKQTAVEWLVDKLMKGEFINSTDELINQAKEMEKEQSFEFWQGGINCTEEGGKSFEQYYKETYEN